ncbi:MAG: DUF2185 domain-containing protein [Clostridiales bacterium]|jgi:hypothetical protein|nr:DUF2185 domain-containing protein [Clostridiales bacterium]
MFEDFGFVLATKMLIDGKKKVSFMYREEVTGPDPDSGWRFFCGDESQEYLDDPNNTYLCGIDWVLDVDASVAQFLDLPPGTALERKSNDDDLEDAEGFDPNA